MEILLNKNKINLDDYEEIVSVTFDNDNPHLAITHKSQGFSANGWHTSLLTKSEDVVVTQEIIKALEQIEVKMSFEEFLRKFMNVYGSDAELLTQMLGMTTEYEDYLENSEWASDEDKAYHQEFLNTRLECFTLLKSSTLGDIPEDQLLSVVSLQKAFEAGVEQFGTTFDSKVEDVVSTTPEAVTEEVIKSTEDITPSINPTTDNNNPEGNEVDIKELMKSAEGQEFLQSEIAKSQEKFTAELETVTAELNKAAVELAAFKEEKDTRVKSGYTNMVKSLTFVDEAISDQVIETLMKGREVEGFDLGLIITQLEKAQSELVKAKEDFVTAESGEEILEEQIDIQKSMHSTLDEQIAATYA